MKTYIDDFKKENSSNVSEIEIQKERRIDCRLEELGEITLEQIENASDARYKIWKENIERYHYIGHGKLCGKQLRYLVKSEHYGWIGALSFSSGAWQLQARDKWIGWNEENRKKNLSRVVCNSRFLIFPNVKVRNLASHILSKSMQQIKTDWEKKCKVEPVLVETFVEKGRYSGSCYKASNFQLLGETSGRGRQDSNHDKRLPIKDIYVYPLQSNIQEELCKGQELKAKVKVAVDWVEEEFEKADLGDRRLKNRLYEIVRDFYGKPQANIPQACGSRAKTKAAYRFLDNETITMEKILQSHYQTTIKRIQKEKIVLAVQDTTSLNYTTHPATENLGSIGSSSDGIIGLLVHDTMAFNIEGTPLGLIDVQCWARDIEEYGKRYRRKELSIGEKESNKWLKSFRSVVEVQKESPKTVIVSIGDREADIYELFELALKDLRGPKLLIRAVQDRALSDEHGHIWDYMQSKAVDGIQRIKVPRKASQAAREAELTIRFSKVELKPPRIKKEKENIKIWAILLKEENAPQGVEPLKWMLYTTIPVNTFEEAIEKMQWYTKRWGIEIYHKTLKSGCKIEERQLGHAERIEACLAIDMVIAWRIYHLTKLGRELPDMPCTVFFEESEWKALVAYKTKNPIAPAEPPSLREAILMVASLGGFLGRKGDGEPGTKTLWLGLQELDIATEMWKVFNDTQIKNSLPRIDDS